MERRKHGTGRQQPKTPGQAREQRRESFVIISAGAHAYRHTADRQESITVSSHSRDGLVCITDVGW
jgi:hypothetical protein